LAIALFYSLGTAVGGLLAPALFGRLIQTGNRWMVFAGYLFGAMLLALAAVVAMVFGVAAEGQSLEALAEDEPPEWEESGSASDTSKNGTGNPLEAPSAAH
jgi:MFS family permease